MALFESENPTLGEKVFQKSLSMPSGAVMTVRGTLAKFGFLLLMIMAGAAYTWGLFGKYQDNSMMTLFWVGLIGGLITALIISFKPNTARYLAPLYGLLEGLALGTLSVLVNAMFAKKNPGIVIQAVGLTFAIALAMFLLYNFKIIRATERFKSIIITASVGIAMFYGIWFIISLFGVNLEFMNFGNTSMLGIGINLFVAGIAAFSLILDFDRIEQGVRMGAPKHMEWYGAFGLTVTIVWLYIQILKLLSRFSSNRN
jgi:uncharacterized YccA/Bax inhibitor family protein